jgi:hypothetical protein
VAVTAIWLAVLVLAVAWESVCRRPGSGWTSLTDIGSRWWASRPGRLVLVGGWGFLGWHVFARYTLPR